MVKTFQSFPEAWKVLVEREASFWLEPQACAMGPGWADERWEELHLSIPETIEFELPSRLLVDELLVEPNGEVLLDEVGQWISPPGCPDSVFVRAWLVELADTGRGFHRVKLRIEEV